MSVDSQIAEDIFWNNLNLDMANVVGSPPYHVESVADRIASTIDCLRVLDLGCGTGRLTNCLAARLGPDAGFVHGVDISRLLLDVAAVNAESNARFWHGDGRTLPIGLKGKFTGAYSVSMFQHIPHEAMWGYLREVHDRLEPGGVFLFTIAVGGVDEFLNHQIDDVSAFADDLMQIYDSVDIDHPDTNGWVWVALRKEA